MRGRPEASACVWRWQQAKPIGPQAPALRRKGALQGLVGLVACGVLLALGHSTLAALAGSLAGLTLVLALVSPLVAYAAVERGLTRVGRGVGLVVGWVALTPVFLLFFVPFGLLFRRGARDPMKRRLDPDARTYWREREPDNDKLERRRRLF